MARKRISSNAGQKKINSKENCTALYVRVSTDKQADEGFSLEAQQERLQAFCVAQGWNVCLEHIYIDAGVSGKSTDRVQFQAMLQAAKNGNVKRIVAMKLDRVARNVREFLATVDQLKEWQCDLVLVKESFDTSTPHGRFALTMFAAMAELEASTITERVMTGKATKAGKGGYNGSACPLGYNYSNGDFTVNQGEAHWVREVFSRFLGGASMNSIAKHMNEVGATTKKGGKWYAVTVDYILRNGAYAGLSQWDGVEAQEGGYPVIVSIEDYEAAQRRLEGFKKDK